MVDDFVSWCDKSFLKINVLKTKDMVVDFRKSPPSPKLTDIKGEKLELVDSYKYLGVIVDNKLCFEPQADAISKKVQQRLFFLRKMNSFNVCTKMMTIFYRSFIESILTFCIIAWYGNLTVTTKNRLVSLVRVASKISGASQTQLKDLYDKLVLRRADSILGALGSDHPLRSQFELLPLGRRFRAADLETKRFKVSFVPSAISSLNSRKPKKKQRS